MGTRSNLGIGNTDSHRKINNNLTYQVIYKYLTIYDSTLFARSLTKHD